MSSSSRLEEILLQWLQARRQGDPKTLGEICRRFPSLRLMLLEQLGCSVEDAGSAPGSREQPAGEGATDRPGKTSRLQETTAYDELQFLAAGGLGEVHRAREQRVGRHVAVKFMRTEHLNNPELRDRFEMEAQITSRLEHPGVVPVYGVGQTEAGQPFYVMRLIEGIGFDQAIRGYYQNRAEGAPRSQLALQFRELLGHFTAVCYTIAYAHNRGIIHRDLKPQNVLLGRFGETMVVNWGLAMPFRRDDRFRESGEETLMPADDLHDTLPGAGTGPYMSPEQLSGYTPTPLSDIYSLGATLYELLTNEAPLSGEQYSIAMIRDRTMRGDVPPPRQRNPGIAAALEAICLRAMQRYPQMRYQTALQLAHDIEAWLADEPVSVHPDRIVERMRRWLRGRGARARTSYHAWRHKASSRRT